MVVVLLLPPSAPGGTAIPGPRPAMAQAPEGRHGSNMRLINWMVYDHLSEIKLIRTDTTLDLSQKAEKVCLPVRARYIIIAKISFGAR